MGRGFHWVWDDDSGFGVGVGPRGARSGGEIGLEGGESGGMMVG